MDIIKLNKSLQKRFNNSVSARIENNICYLEGILDNYDDVVEAGYMAVDKSSYYVVNNIKYSKYEKELIREPLIKDKSLDESFYDVVIIGAGISGVSIARELSRYDLKILVVDKENDIAMQTSSRNDGEIHPGVDLKPNLKKYKFLMEANPMYEKLSEELGFDFNRCGQYVLFTQGWTYPILKIVSKIKTKNGCPTYFVGKKELFKKEPNISKDVKFALYNPTAGVLSPYKYAIAYAENASKNGVEFSFNTMVKEFVKENNKITKVITNRGSINTRLVINAAGVFADDIASLADDKFYSIHPRKGSELILDKKFNNITNSVIAVKTIGKIEKHTKGGGVMRTIDNNILVGPTAKETPYKEDYSTDMEDINNLINKHNQTSSLIKKKTIITYFSGIRAATYEEDFVVEKGRNVSNLIHCAGIQSPGLSTAPAVANEVVRLSIDNLGDVNKNPNFNPYNDKKVILNKLSLEERDKYIKKNPDYGIMVCRCEEISKGEIIDALKSKLTPPTIDGIKRRVRPGMGRCQGSFCQGVVAKIISETRNIPLSEVKKNTENSYISYGSNKGGKK